jgi:hypothetical protein
MARLLKPGKAAGNCLIIDLFLRKTLRVRLDTGEETQKIQQALESEEANSSTCLTKKKFIFY